MDQNDRMARAEDYVFGMMDEKARARAERDMETDTEFRNCVMTVAERLRRLHRVSRPPAALPEETWREIGARIAAMPQMAASGPAPVRAGGGGGLPGMGRTLAHRLGGLRGAIVASCLIAAMGIGYLAGKAPAPLPVAAVAILDGEDGAARALVEIDGAGAVRLVPLSDLAVPQGKALVLWARPAAGEAAALGTLARAAETTWRPGSLPAPPSGLSFAITFEDLPIAPGGTPQGPAVAGGTARATLP